MQSDMFLNQFWCYFDVSFHREYVINVLVAAINRHCTCPLMGRIHKRQITATRRFIAYNCNFFFSNHKNYRDFPVKHQKLFNLSCFKRVSNVYLIRYICRHCNMNHIFYVCIKKLGNFQGFAVVVWCLTKFMLTTIRDCDTAIVMDQNSSMDIASIW